MKPVRNHGASEVQVLLSRAKELMAEKGRDPELVDAIMIVQGWSELLELDPGDITYRSKLDQAAIKLRILMDTRDAMETEANGKRRMEP